ncbi:zinc-dependent metalloprotease [Luedemannella helvata]|uniref:Zinc-dependent metalloprotease n=1 Tax=Luedemannella helvata TaxID=349315 RepID=A0ABP4WK19_9ACTN
MAQFVDWDLAAATAGKLGKTGPRVTLEEATAVVAELRVLADEAAAHVAEYTNLHPAGPPSPVRVVDRRDWANANVDGLREVVAPLVGRLTSGREPSGVFDAVGARAAGVQAGAVLAYLSGKVLGQYEVFSADPGQLLLVAPNIVDAERSLNADPRDFRLWVCLHEVTHRTQFTAVPWLRGHFLAEVAAFVDATGTGEEFVARARRAIGVVSDVVRDPSSRGSILDIVQTPNQKVLLDRITALMTLLEGHAEFVMDGVGPDVVPSVADIRAKFNRRRETANPVESLIRRLLGVDAKLRQYAEGRTFVHQVVDKVGMAGFNKVWTSPLTLPLLDELADPQKWIDRVGAAPPAVEAD